MDRYWRAAKAQGYRSRAAFKLIEINDRFGIFRRGDCVLDLGASPGGWSQVAIDAVMPGKVVAVDLEPMERIRGVISIQCDVLSDQIFEKLTSISPDGFDAIISDMAPNISGAYSTDHARSIALAERARDISLKLLKPGGKFVAKLFDGDLRKSFIESLRPRFRRVHTFRPQASRKSSSELYIVCLGFLGYTHEEEHHA